MSDTATRNTGALDPGAVVPPPIAPPPRLRRRPALLAAAIVAVCLGALLAAWAWVATTNTQNVLVARQAVERGSVIEAADLARVRVSADPAVRPVSASRFNNIVGQRAAVDIAEGGLLTPDSYAPTVAPGADRSIVGVALTPAQAPGLDLQVGDNVRVIFTPAEGEALPSGGASFHQAEVAAVHHFEETGQVVVDLLVPHTQAPNVAVRASTGRVAIVLDSRER